MSGNNNFHRESLEVKNVVLKAALQPGFFNFLHLNPGSLKPHLDELCSIVSKVSVDVIAVSETWFNDRMNDLVLSLAGFTLFRHDRTKKRAGGVALYVRSHLKVKILHKSRGNACCEYLCAEISSKAGSKVAFCVVYNPPRNDQIDPLRNVMRSISHQYEHSFFVGDFNINLLGSYSARARRFTSFLNDCGLICANSEPTNLRVLL
jgi:exonuclease III